MPVALMALPLAYVSKILANPIYRRKAVKRICGIIFNQSKEMIIVDKKEIVNIYKAINRVSNRLNEMSEKLDIVMRMLNAESNRKILINGDGIDGLAELVSTHDSALDELATLVSTIGGENNG
jgi:predicted RNA-binding protein Jag